MLRFLAEGVADGDAFLNDSAGNGSDDSDMATLLAVMQSRSSRGGIPVEHATVMSLCVLAVLGNAAALLAIRGIRRALVPNQMLIASLCCADLLTSVSVFCYRLNTRYLRGYYDWTPSHSPDGDSGGGGSERQCASKLVQGLMMTSHNATLLSLLGLSVDHYCAVALPLQQPVLLSLSRVRGTIVAIWLLAFAFGFSDFFMPAPLHGYCQAEAFVNYCDRVACSTYEPDHLLFVVVAVCLVVMSALYALIATKICSYQRQWRMATPASAAAAVPLSSAGGGGGGSSSASTKKTGPTCSSTRGLVTTVIILVTFCVLWLPFCLFDVFITLKLNYLDEEAWPVAAAYYMGLFQQVGTYLDGLIALNAIVDPIIYAIRMREVQQSLRLLCGAAPCAKLCWQYRLYPSGRRGRGTDGGGGEGQHGVVKVWAGFLRCNAAGYPSMKHSAAAESDNAAA